MGHQTMTCDDIRLRRMKETELEHTGHKAKIGRLVRRGLGNSDRVLTRPAA